MQEREATIYPADALSGRDDLDVISTSVVSTLDQLFAERVRRSPGRVAYTEFDAVAGRWWDYTWRQVAAEVGRWQAALRLEGLRKGDHVALRLRNSVHWAIFDQAALGLGLVVVPLYVADRPDNVNYVLDHAEIKLLLVETLAEWLELSGAEGDTPGLARVVVLKPCEPEGENVVDAASWLPDEEVEPAGGLTRAGELASIVYTSGTTGKPKGVMLSHTNMLSNAYAGLRSVAVTPEDVLLSFLPLSHTLERTVGYYLSMMAGARMVFNRSIAELADDFVHVRPTCVISVPRIFERFQSELTSALEHGPAYRRCLFETAQRIGWDRFEWQQGRGRWRLAFLLWPVLDALVAKRVRDRLGGRLRLAVVGGAPLPIAVSKVFIAMGLNLIQGYGLTESSPSISINTLERNLPSSIGLPLHGVSVRIGEEDELLAKGPNIMMGYWRNQAATDEVLVDGWLHTGDRARIEDGFITIIGRLKDILVLANGEKVPPADMESAIAADPLFDQSMVIGEQLPFLSAVVVLNRKHWRRVARRLKLGDDEQSLSSEPVQRLLLERIGREIREFPGYARIRRVTATLEPWTVDNGLMTPTLKLKRNEIKQRYEREITRMYEGHAVFESNRARSH